MASRGELLEELRWKKFSVLDDGFVCLVDAMGDDGSVVQAARVSYGAGTKRVSDDRTLIRYLMRHRHTTPFEMAEIKLLVRVPMDCWRQWIRHRMASVNEYSTRYSIAIDSTQTTPPDEWRSQAQENRQGSGGLLPAETGAELTAGERKLQEESRRVYQDRLSRGVAREQARKDLLLSTYTEAYWKIDLHNLLHFLHLRMDEHAQQEIRAYAQVIGQEIVAKWVPLAWEAFLDYRRNAVHLSRIEVEVLGALIANSPERANAIVESAGLLTFDARGKAHVNRERSELESKLTGLGVRIPWK
jgi:thymidylate synthase (FAD)